MQEHWERRKWSVFIHPYDVLGVNLIGRGEGGGRGVRGGTARERRRRKKMKMKGKKEDKREGGGAKNS